MRAHGMESRSSFTVPRASSRSAPACGPSRCRRMPGCSRTSSRTTSPVMPGLVGWRCIGIVQVCASGGRIGMERRVRQAGRVCSRTQGVQVVRGDQVVERPLDLPRQVVPNALGQVHPSPRCRLAFLACGPPDQVPRTAATTRIPQHSQQVGFAGATGRPKLGSKFRKKAFLWQELRIELRGCGSFMWRHAVQRSIMRRHVNRQIIINRTRAAASCMMGPMMLWLNNVMCDERDDEMISSHPASIRTCRP